MSIPPPLKGGYNLWYYYPSVPGNVVMSAIFGALTIAHSYFIVRTGRKFCIPIVVGGIFEVVGYIFRVIAHSNTSKVLSYALQSVLILLAPIMFAASVYMCLGRVVVRWRGEQYSFIPIRWLTKIFVSSDIFCFLLQGTGGGLLAKGDSKSTNDLANDIILGGLGLQIAIFMVFVACTSVFYFRISTAQTLAGEFHTILGSLFVLSGLITLRNIVRAIEFGQGQTGYLLQHEWVIFALDGAPMILVMLLTLYWYQTEAGEKRPTTKEHIDLETLGTNDRDELLVNKIGK